MPIGETKKLFLCWPAEEHNLKLLNEEPPGPERLLHIFDRLEGGCCTVVCHDTPLYLSSGTLHAVVTLRGGFMYAGNFMTASNGPAFLRSFRFSRALVDGYKESERRGLFENLWEQVHITIGRPSCYAPLVTELVESWSVIQEVGRKSDKKYLAQHLHKLVHNPEWQQVRTDCSNAVLTRLDEILSGQYKRRVHNH